MLITESRFGGQTIPVVMVDGEPWVVLRPVAKMLGVDYTSTYQRLRRAQAHYRTVQVDNYQGRRATVVILPASEFAYWLLTVRNVPQSSAEVHMDLCAGLASTITKYTTSQLLATA